MLHSFWPSLPSSRQAGRKTNTLALTLGIPPRKTGASTEIGHLGAEKPGAYPVAPCKDIRRVQQGCRLAYNQDTISAACSLVLRLSTLTHTWSGIGRVQSLGFF